MTRHIIRDSSVINVWIGEDGEVEINPDWYEENGTPMDSEGNDMTYLRTEIEED